jgi:Xaa-Pro aminopeptidase
MFNASVYKNRRAALLKGLAARGLEKGLVVLIGNGESPMNYRDNAYPFRQDSSFLYFFGLSKPGLAASIDLASGEAFLYGDDPSIDDIVWTGPEISVAELAEASGAQGSQARPGLAAAARGAVGHGAAHLLFFPPYRDETRVELGSLLGVSPQAVDAAASIPLVRAAVELREVKDSGEIAEMETAVATSVAMHQAALALARPGMRESDIAARVTEVALAEGGYLSFPAIATTRGATLHNHDYGNALQEGGLFLLDAGAEAPSGYAGDLTSTFPIGKRYDERQKAVYEIVLSMGKAATALLRPGLPFLAAHEAAARAMVEGFKSVGLMRGDTEAAVACGAYALFFVHGLGHQIGLDVHDMENYGEKWVGYDGGERSPLFGLKSLRLAKPLRTGMVHSVEPGVYFIPALIEEWRKEKKFGDFIAYDRLGPFLDFGGIRNEEDWLITEKGARRLGPDFDKSVAAMEGRRA